jgi:hypothetical protein
LGSSPLLSGIPAFKFVTELPSMSV